MRVDERGGDRLAWRLAAPQHELEHRVEALALLNRRFGDRFGLLEAEAFAAARIEDGRMAELLRKLVRNAVNRQAADLVERVEDGTLVRWRVRE